MWFGYILTFNNILKKEEKNKVLPNQLQKINWGLVWLIWLITFFFNITSVTQGIRGIAATQSFIWFNYLSLILLIYFAVSSLITIWYFKNPTTFGLIWLWINILTNLFLSLVIASRGAPLILLRLFSQYFYATKKYAWRIVIIGILITILLVPTGSMIRNSLFAVDQGIGVDLTTRQDIVNFNITTVFTRPFSDLVNETMILFTSRQGSLLDITSAATTLHPKYLPYIGVDLAKAIIFQLIPRVVWPNKPSGDLGLYNITQVYYSKYGGGFSTIGIFGDAFRFGGWLAVVFWGIIIGIFSAWLYYYYALTGNEIGNAIYLTFLFNLVTYDTTLFNLLLGILQKGLLLIAFVYFIQIKTRKRV